jgi:hypothetical protein
MKRLVFYSPETAPSVRNVFECLSSKYTVQILSEMKQGKYTISIEEYLSDTFDCLIVCNDYTFFLKAPVNADRVYFWKTPVFQHPVYSGTNLSGSSLLENLVLDGIIEGNITSEKLVSILESIPLKEISNALPVVRLSVNSRKI